MLKLINLRLGDVKYVKGNIGNDIKIEVDVLGKIFSTEKRMKSGSSFYFDKNIAIFETDRKYFEFEILITIIEKDFLYNDVGRKSFKLNVDTSNLKK